VLQLLPSTKKEGEPMLFIIALTASLWAVGYLIACTEANTWIKGAALALFGFSLMQHCGVLGCARAALTPLLIQVFLTVSVALYKQFIGARGY